MARYSPFVLKVPLTSTNTNPSQCFDICFSSPKFLLWRSMGIWPNLEYWNNLQI